MSAKQKQKQNKRNISFFLFKQKCNKTKTPSISFFSLLKMAEIVPTFSTYDLSMVNGNCGNRQITKRQKETHKTSNDKTSKIMPPKMSFSMF